MVIDELVKSAPSLTPFKDPSLEYSLEYSHVFLNINLVSLYNSTWNKRAPVLLMIFSLTKKVEEEKVLYYGIYQLSASTTSRSTSQNFYLPSIHNPHYYLHFCFKFRRHQFSTFIVHFSFVPKYNMGLWIVDINPTQDSRT